MDGFTTRPELAGSLGIVATTHWLASQTGMAVLEQGGNAADAAVAAASVPGAFGAWTVLLQTWGTWTLRQVLEPAMALASDGAPVLPRVSDMLSRMAEHFRTSWPTSARTYLDGDGNAPQPWSRLRLP